MKAIYDLACFLFLLVSCLTETRAFIPSSLKVRGTRSTVDVLRGTLISTKDALDLKWVEVNQDGSLIQTPLPLSFDRTPVILLHGLLGQTRNFGSWSRDLKDLHLEPDRRVILADLRNHGESPHHPSMCYAAMAADVLRLIETLGCEKAVLVGHSMGGKVAMAMAMLAPSRVERLCVLDIAPVKVL